jgi:hypothetical protein
MEVILKEDVPNLGYKDDIVSHWTFVDRQRSTTENGLKNK